MELEKLEIAYKLKKDNLSIREIAEKVGINRSSLSVAINIYSMLKEDIKKSKEELERFKKEFQSYKKEINNEWIEELKRDFKELENENNYCQNNYYDLELECEKLRESNLKMKPLIIYSVVISLMLILLVMKNLGVLNV